MSKVKITDIAERSGVSLTTVSRYFNHPELLSQETQNKIKTAIQELNYQQDNLARILVTGESNLVGVIFPHLHLSFYTELLNQLVKYGKEKGYKTGYIMWPLRTALSGKQMTPAGATEIMEVIGKEETVKRIKAAIEKING